MKKQILSFAFICCLVLPVCLCCFSGCSKQNLNGFMANISDFTSIGVGNIYTENANATSTLNMSSSNVLLNGKKENKKVLFGIDQLGKIKPVKFKKDGKEEEPQWSVYAFNQTKRYMFVTYTAGDYSDEDIYSTIWFYEENHSHFITYIIDKQTNLVFLLDMEATFRYNMYKYDCGDSFVIEQYCYADNGIYYKYYKVGVVDNKLEVKEIFDTSKVANSSFIVLNDIYGNSIVERYFGNSDYSYYVLKNSGQLVEIEGNPNIHNWVVPGEITLFRSVDGQIYYDGKVLTANGDWQTVENFPQNYLLDTDNLICSTEEADYYYHKDLYDGKIIKSYNNTAYPQFEEIENIVSMADSEKIISGTNMYAITADNVISKINFMTGEIESHTLNNDIILKSITLHNLDQIAFNGTNSYLQDVNGLISATGSISYEYTEPDFVCYYIFPLNLNND